MLPSWIRSSSVSPRPAVALRDRDHQTQVGLDQRVLCAPCRSGRRAWRGAPRPRGSAAARGRCCEVGRTASSTPAAESSATDAKLVEPSGSSKAARGERRCAHVASPIAVSICSRRRSRSRAARPGGAWSPARSASRRWRSTRRRSSCSTPSSSTALFAELLVGPHDDLATPMRPASGRPTADRRAASRSGRPATSRARRNDPVERCSSPIRSR